MDGDVLEVTYGSGNNPTQYAALHLDSGYFRLISKPGSGWGTSVILLPSFWKDGLYRQGSTVTVSCKEQGHDFFIAFQGEVWGLKVNGSVRIMPPQDNSITAEVEVQTKGEIVPDNRPGEAFKPVMLSSMRISEDAWDAKSAFIGGQTYNIPPEGWIIHPPRSASVFGLQGGTSSWKAHAPTIEVSLAQELQISGWVTKSADPNDDNVDLWAASDRVLPSWRYVITARQ